MNRPRPMLPRRRRQYPGSTSIAVTVAAAALLLAGCSSDGDDATASRQPSVPSALPSTVPAGPAATANAAEFPVTVSSCGNETTVAGPPGAVVIGWPTIMDTLVALGVDEAAIGWTSGSLAPTPVDASRAVEISPDYQASREVVLASGLDFFITNDENQIGGADGGLGYDDLAQAGAGAYVLGGYCLDQPAPTSIDVVYQDILALGQVFGVRDIATTLVDELRARVDAARIVTAEEAPTIAMVQPFDGKLYALTGAYYRMAIDAAGYDSVFGDMGNFSEISAEVVLTLQPDVVAVVYNTAGSRAADIDAAVALLASSPAVAEGRVIEIDSATISAGGVSLFDVIEQLAAAGDERDS